MSLELKPVPNMPQILKNILDTGEFNTGKGYVELTLDQSIKSYYNQLAEEFFNKDEFYYAEKLPHIAGNVTQNMHLTLYYGYKECDKLDKLNLLQKSNLPDLFKVNRVFFRKNQLYNYYVIMLDYETNIGLNSVYKLLQKMDSEPNYDYEFKPHSTIAYIKSSISEEILQKICDKMSKKIIIKLVKINSLKFAEFDSNIMEFNF